MKGSDITSTLLQAHKGVDRPQLDPMLRGDTKLIIIAGSDTTAATLTYLFYHLAQDPRQVAKLRDELRPLTRGQWSDKDIRHAQHLNGAINEALRLHPPVPSGLSRLTPKEGMLVGDTYVPGGVTFIMPQYVMGRGKTAFSLLSVHLMLTTDQTSPITRVPTTSSRSVGTANQRWSSTKTLSHRFRWDLLAALGRTLLWWNFGRLQRDWFWSST